MTDDNTPPTNHEWTPGSFRFSENELSESLTDKPIPVFDAAQTIPKLVIPYFIGEGGALVPITLPMRVTLVRYSGEIISEQEVLIVPVNKDSYSHMGATE